MPSTTRRDLLRGAALSAGACCLAGREAAAQAPAPVFPGATWGRRTPLEVGLNVTRLNSMKSIVGGRGCVVRYGYLAYEWGDTARIGDVFSAAKPLISALLLIAIQEGKLPGVDSLVVDAKPALATINKGKDRTMTWRHLASMTSGYGLIEAPGAAFSYNDYAIALYFETLMTGVYRQHHDEVLRTRLGLPLQWEKPYRFNYAGAGQPGRLGISPRDFARFGLLFLNRGNWNGTPILHPGSYDLALGSVVPPTLPMTTKQQTDMLKNQLSFGGNKTQTKFGPGWYSFNWWVNGVDRTGLRLMPQMPMDCYVASGLWGRDVLLISPSQQLVICWTDSGIRDQFDANVNPRSNMAKALGFIVQAMQP